MKEKRKLVGLVVFLVLLVALNVWRGGKKPVPVAGGNARTGAGKEASPIPDGRLRVDLLERRAKQIEVGRNIFEYVAKAAPPTAVPIPMPAGSAPASATEAPPAPAPLRFYGFAEDGASGQKRVFLTDGEEIFIAAEGETLQRRYRVARVRPASIELVDIVAGRQWVIPLEQP